MSHASVSSRDFLCPPLYRVVPEGGLENDNPRGAAPRGLYAPQHHTLALVQLPNKCLKVSQLPWRTLGSFIRKLALPALPWRRPTSCPSLVRPLQYQMLCKSPDKRRRGSELSCVFQNSALRPIFHLPFISSYQIPVLQNSRSRTARLIARFRRKLGGAIY